MAWISVIFLALCLHAVEPKTFRWCYQGDEMKKCNDFMNVIPLMANKSNIQGSFDATCVKGESDNDCIMKIKDNKADFVTLDGGKVYTAGKDYGLVPIVAEKTGDGSDSLGYYAVAVAKKDTAVTLKSLKGKKTCHTGYGRTSGWNLPIGYFLRQSGFKTGCGEYIDVQSASKYFSQSCVPGLQLKVKGYPNLCELCPNKDCSNAKYLGYVGAFNCMKDGVGDVAFVKHSTTATVVGASMSDYKYLCSDGTTKVVTNTSHVNCNFAQSVSHTVVTRKDDGNADYIKILMKAGELCINKAKQCNGFQIFNSTQYGKANLLFKDQATAFADVGDKNTYVKWLKQDYVNDIEALNKPGPACASAFRIAVFPGLLVAMVALIKTLM